MRFAAIMNGKKVFLDIVSGDIQLTKSHCVYAEINYVAYIMFDIACALDKTFAVSQS